MISCAQIVKSNGMQIHCSLALNNITSLFSVLQSTAWNLARTTWPIIFQKKLRPQLWNSGSEFWELAMNLTMKVSVSSHTLWKKHRSLEITFFCTYRKRILGLSGGIEEIGNVRWELALCLLLAWIICYFCVFNGVKSTGKVSAHTSQHSCLCWPLPDNDR